MDVIIKRASEKDSQNVGRLFDLYRQFYSYESNINLSIDYINERIQKSESVIFFARNGENQTMGFVQLYETFDSLNINKKLILYDLFVKEIFRKKRIGSKLMNTAKKFAVKKKIKIIELSTAITNKKAQSLYESLEYKRDKEYYNYYLEL